MTQIADLSVLVRADIGQFQQGMNTVSSGIAGFGSNVTRIGNNMTTLGTSMSGVTLPIVAGLGYAVVAATNFDTAMTNVNAVLQNSAADAAALNAEVLAIGSSAVAGPQAVAEAYYDIVGGVADASTHMSILNAAIATSEAGASDLGATTNALISVMNSYGMSAEDAARVSDVLTATVAAGVGSMDELAAAMPQVAGLANAMGISWESLGGMFAYGSTTGASFSQVGTQMTAAMTALLNPNQAMVEVLGDLGFESGLAAVEALGLQGAYQAMANAGYGDEFAAITGSVEGLRAATFLTAEGATEFLGNFAGGIDGATAAAREIQLGGAQMQFDMLKASVDGLAITLGNNLLIGLQDLATTITPIVQAVSAWAIANPELSGTLVAVVGGAAGLMAAMIPLGMVIAGVGATAGLLATGFGAIGTAATGVFGPIIGIALAVGGLVALSGDFPAMQQAWQGVVDAFNSLTTGGTDYAALGTALTGLADISLTALADGVINLVGTLVGQDFTTIGKSWGSIGGMLEAAWTTIQTVLTMAEMGVQNAGLQVQLSVQQFVADLRNTIMSATGGAIDIAPTIEMDIAATQAQIQANIDEAIASVTPTAEVSNIAVTTSTEGTTVDTTGAEWSAVNAINELNPDSTMTANITLSGSAYDTEGARTGAVDALGATGVSAMMVAQVNLTANVDSSSATATINASVSSLTGAYTAGNAEGISGAPVADVEGGATTSITLPSGATGVNVLGEGLMYVHANEQLLNAADTEVYRNGGGGGGGGSTQNYYINSVGTSPYENYAMIKRASRNAAPE